MDELRMSRSLRGNADTPSRELYGRTIGIAEFNQCASDDAIRQRLFLALRFRKHESRLAAARRVLKSWRGSEGWGGGGRRRAPPPPPRGVDGPGFLTG